MVKPIASMSVQDKSASATEGSPPPPPLPLTPGTPVGRPVDTAAAAAVVLVSEPKPGMVVAKREGVAKPPERMGYYHASKTPVGGEDEGTSCDACGGFLRHWRYTKSTADPERPGVWTHKCAACHAAARDISFEDAVMEIVGQRTKREKKRSAEFRNARDNVQAVFEFVGSNKEVKRLARSSFSRLVGPVAEILKMKVLQMAGVDELIERHSDLLRRLGEQIRLRANADITDGLLVDLAILEAEIKLASAPTAFAKHGETVQAEFQGASTFSDEWFSFEEGSVTLYLRSWYICHCGAAISSKVWQRRLATPWAKKQRYYCICCGRVYRHSFGQVVECKVTAASEPSFALAAVPPQPLEDVRATGFELKLNPASPTDLYNALQMYKPSQGTVFRPCQPAEVTCP